MTSVPTTGITFKTDDDVRHPCRAQFYLNGEPISEHGTMGENEDVKITAISAGSVSMEALRDGVEVTVTAIIRCPPAPDLDAIVIADQGYIRPRPGGFREWLERIRRWVVSPFWLALAIVGWPLGGERWFKWCSNQFPYELGGQ